MAERIFREMLQAKWDERKFVCMGLDTDLKNEKFPKSAKKNSIEKTLLAVNFPIINVTHDLVCAYKLNTAFYEGWGIPGISALLKTIEHIKKAAPAVPIIGDIKRGDTENSNRGYAKFAFEICGFDAVTLNPFLGEESLEPFLSRSEKGLFILCRTSNKGAGKFQDLKVVVEDRYIPFYLYIAYRVVNHWNKNGNCGLVVGATYPVELGLVRAIVGDDMPILIPGIGDQGGDLEKIVKAVKKNMIISASRSIIFASSGADFAEAARSETIKLQEAIDQSL